MFNYLKELIVCPKCKSNLSWNTISQNENHIINADIDCNQCGQTYFVKNGIGNFIIDFQPKNSFIGV